jgi:hypothetical protein
MPIALTPPIVVPSVPEKTYNLWFFANLRFDNLHDTESATITFDKVPFDGVSDYLWTHKETITRPFWSVVADIPQAAVVMNSVINVLPSIEEYNPS